MGKLDPGGSGVAVHTTDGTGAVGAGVSTAPPLESKTRITLTKPAITRPNAATIMQLVLFIKAPLTPKPSSIQPKHQHQQNGVVPFCKVNVAHRDKVPACPRGFREN
jgi:hypothetical protein